MPRDVVQDFFQFSERDDPEPIQQVLESINFFHLQATGHQHDDLDGFADYEFDYLKLVLFCILYSDEQPGTKLSALFEVMMDQNQRITNKNGTVRQVIATLTIICNMIPAEFIKLVSAASVSAPRTPPSQSGPNTVPI